MKKVIVVSAVNIVEGGTLAVLKECLEYLSVNLAHKYEIIVLVNRRTLFSFENLKYLEFPKSKKNWINRLYYEYIYFYKLSKKINPFLWLSFHDITPNVKAERLAVYCHNPSPFPPLLLEDIIWGGYKYIMFKLFYRYLYAINIKKNNFVILQQVCLRKKFEEITGFNADNIIVAHPTISSKIKSTPFVESKNIFFYPALPRVFKNFEVICKAAKILLKQGINNFEVIFTISGDENVYAKHIYNSFRSIKNIKFLGILPREKVFDLYNKASCLIFPSKLETWGMPIIENKLFLKPILLADLEYAHETLDSYEKVKFFNPDSPKQLANAMKAIMNGTIVYEKTESNIIKEPFAQSWEELFNILLGSNPDISLKYNTKVRQPANV